MALVYEEALAHPTWCPIQPQDCWTELPHAAWNPLQRRLIDGMPGERIQPRALALPGRLLPRRLIASHVELAEPEHAANPLAFLMNPLFVPSSEYRAVPRRRPGGRNRGSLPPHPERRRLARSGGDRVRLGRSRRVGLGESASARLGSHARAGHRRGPDSSRPRAHRSLRLD